MEFRHPKQIWNDPKQEIVDFGRIFGIGVFLIAGAVQWYKCDWSWSLTEFSKEPQFLIVWWMVAGIVLSLSTAVPWLMRPVYFLWLTLGQSLGWVMQHFILAVVFYGIFAPVGLLYRRWCRVVTKGADPDCDSYWEDKPQPSSDKSYYRQF